MSNLKKQRVKNQGELKNLKDIVQVKKNIERGDLQLNQVIDNVLTVVGETKIGKTTFCHAVSGNPLQGAIHDGQCKLIRSVNNRNQVAKIGLGCNSETDVPNIFETKISQQPVCLIDTPGYQDSYGIYKIFANSYFHYRVFSISKKMKFLICFDINAIRNTCESLQRTIIQFTNYFKDYDSIKHQIWESCLFIFNKTDGQLEDVENCLNKLQKFEKEFPQKKYDQAVAKNFKQFLKYIVKNKRVFCIKRYKDKQKVNAQNWLKDIDKMVPNWWQRKLNSKNKVDMEKIKITIGPKLLQMVQSQKNKQQYQQLIKYFNLKIYQQFSPSGVDTTKPSLRDVLKQVKQDAINGFQNHKFLDVIGGIVNDRYKILFGQDPKQKKQLQNKNYCQEIKQKRTKRMKQLFGLGKNSTTANSQDKTPYFLKKIQFIKQLKNLLSLKLENELQANRSQKTIQQLQQVVIQIFVSLIKLSYKKKNEEIIMQYGYLVFLMLQENKLFISLTSQDIKNLEAQTSIVSEIIRVMIDFLNSILGLFQDSINYTFLKQIPARTQFPYKYQVLQFIQDVQIPQSVQNQEKNAITLKKIDIYLQFSHKHIQNRAKKGQIDMKLQKLLIQKLIDSRYFLEDLYDQANDQDQERKFVSKIRQITWNLGKILQYAFKYELAISIFTTIDAVQSICRNYEILLKQQPDKIQWLNKYCLYLTQHMRVDDAIKILQKKIQDTFEYEKFSQINRILSGIIQNQQINNISHEYSSRVVNSKFFIPLIQHDGDIQSKIMAEF